MCCRITRGKNSRVLATALANLDLVARFDSKGGNVHGTAINTEMSMSDKLASLRTARGEPHAVHHIVQTLFQHPEHLLTGDTFLTHGFFIKVAELTLQNAVVTPCFLLLAKLQTVSNQLGFLIFAVLSRSKIALFDRALLTVAALAFQKQLHALAAAKPAYGAFISCQSITSQMCAILDRAG